MPGVAALLAVAATQFAAPLGGSDAYIGLVERNDCFKVYVSDGTERGATLSVFLNGCAEDGRLRAERYGVVVEADVTRWRARGTVTLPDGRSHPFDASSGDRGGLVARRFTHDGIRYRTGVVVLKDNSVRGRVMRIGRGLYGDTRYAPGTGRAVASCEQAERDREILRAQVGRMSHQSGRWELQLNRGGGPSSSTYNRLSQAMGALDETIFALEPYNYATCDSPS